MVDFGHSIAGGHGQFVDREELLITSTAFGHYLSMYGFPSAYGMDPNHARFKTNVWIQKLWIWPTLKCPISFRIKLLPIFI